MSFVGIDTALVTVGVFAFEPGEWWLADTICSKPRKGPDRLLYLRDEIGAWLDKLPSITGVAIEDGSFDSTGRIYQLGGIQHIAQIVAWERTEGALTNVAPAQLKKFQTAKPGATKEWMLEAANEFIASTVIPEEVCNGLVFDPSPWPQRKITDDNIADALGLARIAHALHTEDVRTRAEAEIVVSLQKSTRIHE